MVYLQFFSFHYAWELVSEVGPSASQFSVVHNSHEVLPVQFPHNRLEIDLANLEHGLPIQKPKNPLQFPS